MKKFKFMSLLLFFAALGTNAFADVKYAVYEGVWYQYDEAAGNGSKTLPYQAVVFGVADTDDGWTSLTIPASFEKQNQADQKMYFDVTGFDADWAQQGSTNVDDVDGDEDFAAVSVTLNELTVNIDNFTIIAAVEDDPETVEDETAPEINPFPTMTDGLKKLTSLTLIDSKKAANKWAPTQLTMADLHLSGTVVKKLATLNIGKTGVTLDAGAEFKVQATGEWAKLTAITLPEGLKAIGASTLEGSAITAITIPAGVVLIGDAAFKGVKGITTVAIPAATVGIGASAFEGCTGLTSVDFSKATKLASIGADAFKGDTGLTTIDLSKAVIVNGLSAAFTGCSNITAVTLNDKVEVLVNGLFADTKIEEIVAEGATTVGTIMGTPSKDKPNTTLKKVTLGPVLSIAKNAFQYCQALEEVTLGFDAEAAAEYQDNIQAIIDDTEAYLKTFQDEVDEKQGLKDDADLDVEEANATLSEVIMYNVQLAQAAGLVATTAAAQADALAAINTAGAEIDGWVDLTAATVDAYFAGEHAEALDELYTEYTTAATEAQDAVDAKTALVTEIDGAGYVIDEDQIATATYVEDVTNAVTAQIEAGVALAAAQAELETQENAVAEILANAEELEDGLIVPEKAFYYCTKLATFNYAPDNADAKYVNDEAFLGCSSSPLVLFVTSTIYQSTFKAPYQTTYGNEAATTVTTVADKGTSGKFFAKFHATSRVSIDPEAAKVYSVYVDEGTAFFQALQKRGGVYVLEAGDNVILKTDEAAEIEIAPYNGTASKSSVLTDDVICSEVATTVTALQDAGDIATGEYLYRLTNNAASGGFGFTYYTKDAIAAGQFFISSTIAPSASGRINVVWLDENGNEEEGATAIKSIAEKAKSNGTIYNLAGQKVNASYKGVVIQDGKKMIMK